jgi:hypothetical protein
MSGFNRKNRIKYQMLSTLITKLRNIQIKCACSTNGSSSVTAYNANSKIPIILDLCALPAIILFISATSSKPSKRPQKKLKLKYTKLSRKIR